MGGRRKQMMALDLVGRSLTTDDWVMVMPLERNCELHAEFDGKRWERL